MPERLAATSPYKPVAEIVGSGPYRFLPEEHISGARAAYERFPLYQPRAGGPVGFHAGLVPRLIVIQPGGEPEAQFNKDSC